MKHHGFTGSPCRCVSRPLHTNIGSRCTEEDVGRNLRATYVHGIALSALPIIHLARLRRPRRPRCASRVRHGSARRAHARICNSAGLNPLGRFLREAPSARQLRDCPWPARALGTRTILQQSLRRNFLNRWGSMGRGSVSTYRHQCSARQCKRSGDKDTSQRRQLLRSTRRSAGQCVYAGLAAGLVFVCLFNV